MKTFKVILKADAIEFTRSVTDLKKRYTNKIIFITYLYDVKYIFQITNNAFLICYKDNTMHNNLIMNDAAYTQEEIEKDKRLSKRMVYLVAASAFKELLKNFKDYGLIYDVIDCNPCLT